VADIRTQYSIDTGTQAYADLEGNEAFVSDRTQYERFFGDNLENNENIIGFVAVSGNQILGADVFGHPELLNRQYTAVLNSYATDAITMGNNHTLKESELQAFIDGIYADLAKGQGFREEGKLVHYAKLR
jgi:hypothetical protein